MSESAWGIEHGDSVSKAMRLNPIMNGSKATRFTDMGRAMRGQKGAKNSLDRMSPGGRSLATGGGGRLQGNASNYRRP